MTKMKNSKYAKAYKEVLEIIKYFPEEEYNKIPTEKIEFYKSNMDNEYEFSINPAIDLSEQNISKEANAIIVALYQDYLATEEQRQIIKEILELNKKKVEQHKREKYNSNDFFRNSSNTVTVEKKQTNEIALAEYKENFFIKFKKFILKLLHIK